MSKKEKSEDVVISRIAESIDFLQTPLTLTGWFRWIAQRFFKKKHLPKHFYSSWVLAWLILVGYYTVFFDVSRLRLGLIIYRLWEMILVNVWLFLIYRQIGRGKKNPFDYVRIIVSLAWQYLTVLLGYSVIYRYLYYQNPASFIGIKADNAITWIYYSLTTLTTLGYGDIHPCQNYAWAQLAVISEVFMGILYVVWFLGVTINKLEMQWPGEKISE